MKSDSWVHPLADMGYKAQLIEQTIRTEKSGKSVKPDVITTSNKTIHSIVFDCKGGTTIDDEQISRYENLIKDDLFRWIDVYTKDNYSHDVCILDFKKNNASIITKVKNFPILLLSDLSLEKNNTFSKSQVNEKFETSISTKNLKPPISYYPFSENEDRRVIIPHVLRAMISVLMDRSTRDVDVTNPDTFTSQKILLRIHKMWKILSRDHQNALKELVKEIVIDLKSTYPKFESQILAIQNSGKTNTTALSNLIKTCEKILEKEEEKIWLDDYFNE
ncbi:MAG: hypothetical protein IIC67_06525 [Thaumarchaeota archaeon]|nr:hypothetical protein [Nitrososphaerota archaeon]